MRGIHRWPVKSPHKGPVTRKMFLFDGVIMVITIWLQVISTHTFNIWNARDLSRSRRSAMCCAMYSTDSITSLERLSRHWSRIHHLRQLIYYLISSTLLEGLKHSEIDENCHWPLPSQLLLVMEHLLVVLWHHRSTWCDVILTDGPYKVYNYSKISHVRFRAVVKMVIHCVFASRV